MNYRINTTAITILVVVIVIAVGIFGYTLYRSNQQVTTDTQTSATTSSTVETPAIITAKHQYKNGVHTIAGEVTLPTACHTLATSPFFVGGSQQDVEVRFTSTLNEVNGTCAPEVTARRFKVTFTAPEQAKITALFNGVPVQLNLVPVEAGEDLDNFDLYMKG